MRSESYSTWFVSVSGLPSVCLSVTMFSATTRKKSAKIAIVTGSVLHWLDFKKGDFHKTIAFKSYGVKTK